jgi:hypothetical protein
MMSFHFTMKKLFALSIIAFSLSSCSALTRYRCNSQYAFQKGMEDAGAGRTAMPGRRDGESCDGDYTGVTFSKDYAAGFQQKKREICNTNNAANAGRTDGTAGATGKPGKQALSLCVDERDARKIEQAYDGEFLKAFCSIDRASKLGADRGRAWEADAGASAFGECRNRGALEKAAENAYRQELARHCTPEGAQQAGVAEANAHKDAGAMGAKFALCPKVAGSTLETTFRQSFENQKNKMQQEAAARAVAEQERLRLSRLAEFERTTSNSVAIYGGRLYPTVCRIAADRGSLSVEVNNPFADQILIQGTWRVIYYGHDFQKITEDRTQEALLLPPGSRKTFQKLTLPRDAHFCRAELIGA